MSTSTEQYVHAQANKGYGFVNLRPKLPRSATAGATATPASGSASGTATGGGVHAETENATETPAERLLNAIAGGRLHFTGISTNSLKVLRAQPADLCQGLLENLVHYYPSERALRRSELRGLGGGRRAVSKEERGGPGAGRPKNSKETVGVGSNNGFASQVSRCDRPTVARASSASAVPLSERERGAAKLRELRRHMTTPANANALHAAASNQVHEPAGQDRATGIAVTNGNAAAAVAVTVAATATVTAADTTSKTVG